MGREEQGGIKCLAYGHNMQAHTGFELTTLYKVMNSKLYCWAKLVPIIVTTGAGNRGYNHCVELHWHLSVYKFNIKRLFKQKKNKSS